MQRHTLLLLIGYFCSFTFYSSSVLCAPDSLENIFFDVQKQREFSVPPDAGYRGEVICDTSFLGKIHVREYRNYLFLIISDPEYNSKNYYGKEKTLDDLCDGFGVLFSDGHSKGKDLVVFQIHLDKQFDKSASNGVLLNSDGMVWPLYNCYQKKVKTPSSI